jgi:hypothetical protein
MLLSHQVFDLGGSFVLGFYSASSSRASRLFVGDLPRDEVAVTNQTMRPGRAKQALYEPIESTGCPWPDLENRETRGHLVIAQEAESGVPFLGNL